MRQIQTHQAIMRSHDSLINLQIGRGTRQALNIDTPSLLLQVESLQGTSLTRQLNGVNMLVSTVVSCSWVALGVFVAHWRAESVEDGAGGYVLGGDEDDGFSLTLDFFFLGGKSTD